MSFVNPDLPPGLRAYLLSIPFDKRAEAIDDISAELEKVAASDSGGRKPSDYEDIPSYAWRERDSERFIPESRKEIREVLESYATPEQMPHLRHFINSLEHKRSDEALAELEETTFDLTSYMTTIDEFGDPVLISGRNNLIIGDIQSGKTQALLALIAAGIDMGARLVVIITGTTDKLREQTQRRLNEDLIGSNETILSPTDCGDLMRWDPKNKASERYWGNLRKLVYTHLKSDESNCVVLAVKKNHAVLDGVHYLCDMVHSTGMNPEYPILIIDDEADSASINTTTDKPYDVNDSKIATAVHKRIVRIRNDFPSLYWNVTATPAASIFLHPDDPLFPDHAHVLDPHDLYLSPHDVFIKHPEHIVDPCLINDYSPPRSSKEIVSHLRSLTKPPRSMTMAMLNHAISGAVHHLEPRPVQPHGKFHAAMIHMCTQIEGQREAARLVRLALADAKALLEDHQNEPNPNSDASKAVHRFRTNKLAIYPSDATFPDTEDIIVAAIEVIDDTEIRIINSVSEDDLNYDESEFPLNLVVVGGLVLSRGLTIQNLHTTYMCRQASTAVNDTMLQAARWFGPLSEDAHLMSIHLTPTLAKRFTNITWDDMMLRKEMKRIKEEDLDLRDAAIPFHASHELSRKDQHMRKSTKAGERVQINAPWIDTGGKASRALRSELARFESAGHEPARLISDSGVFQGLKWDISLPEFDEFLSAQMASPSKKGGADQLKSCMRRIKMLINELENLPRVHVVLRHGSGKGMHTEIPDGIHGFGIKRVKRSSHDNRTVDQLISGVTQGQGILTSDWFIDGFEPKGPTSKREGWRSTKDPILCIIYMIDEHDESDRGLIGKGPWVCFAVNLPHGGPGGSVMRSKHRGDA